MLNSRQQILIVEDDPVTRSLLATYLAEAGFRILEAATGEACRSLLHRQGADLVLLDIGLPDCDGMQLGRDICAGSHAGVIFVTNHADEVDRVVGLELGGDDYIVKPVQLRELLARVRAVLRRREVGKKSAHETMLSFGEWTIDLVRRELMDSASQGVRLTRGEFDLLAALVEARGRPLTRSYLSEVISNQETEGNERTVDALVVRLRRKMRQAQAAPDPIVTLHGVGYKVGVEVRRR